MTNPDPCRLFVADGHPIQQSGVIELTLHFQEFPNKQFTHSFIVANIKHAILGLDFLKFHNFVIDTAASTVDISNSTKENILSSLGQMALESTTCGIVHHARRTRAHCPTMVSSFKLSSGTVCLLGFSCRAGHIRKGKYKICGSYYHW